MNLQFYKTSFSIHQRNDGYTVTFRIGRNEWELIRRLNTHAQAYITLQRIKSAMKVDLRRWRQIKFLRN